MEQIVLSICGNTIGAYSFIGAGTVVTKNIPNHALMVGNPGVIIGWVDRKGIRLNLIRMVKVFVENIKKRRDSTRNFIVI